MEAVVWREMHSSLVLRYDALTLQNRRDQNRTTLKVFFYVSQSGSGGNRDQHRNLLVHVKQSQ